jgi:hypothetical protein
MLPMLGRAARRLGIAGFYYNDWASVETAGGSEFDFAGLFRFQNGVFTAKPVFSAFRSDALALEGCRRKGSFATRCLTAS